MAGRVTEGQVEGNICICFIFTCEDGQNLCSESNCTKCRACCSPECEDCKKHCKQGEKCKCTYIRCGCKTDCYAKGNNGKCQGQNDCKRCVARKCDTVGGGRCICYQCSCGTQCNGFLCACCYFCNPGKCKRNGTCDGYVLGKCGPGGCKGHGTYDDDGRPVFEKECNCGPKGSGKDCTCYTSERNPNDKKCRCIFGDRQEDGNCLIICDLCGKLCSQDSYIHEGTIVVASLAVAMILIIVCSKYRDKFRRVFYELSDSFSRAYTNNLVGDRIPGEGNIERYPAFRPMPYAGLS